MARFVYVSLLRCLAVCLLAVLAVVPAHAQVTKVSDDVSTPIEGAGHDYIHELSETVNPANGSLSVRIQVPVPKGRGFTIPFSFNYDSNTIHHLVPQENLPGWAEWVSNLGYVSGGGWSYGVPVASATWTPVKYYTGQGDGSVPPNAVYDTCDNWSNYMFSDGSSQHSLGLATQVPEGNNTCTLAGDTRQSGDAEVQGYLFGNADPYFNPLAPNPSPLVASTADGTLYTFPNFSHVSDTSPGVYSGLPSKIEDRNGNLITVTDNDSTLLHSSLDHTWGSFTFTDTAGRTLINSNGFAPIDGINTVTVSGTSYVVSWGYTNAAWGFQYGTDYTWAGTWPGSPATGGPDGQGGIDNVCYSGMPSVQDRQAVVSAISLPNGKEFQFRYGDDPNLPQNFRNPYGLLAEIDYPTGAMVRYTWKLSDTMNEVADYPGALVTRCNIFGGDPELFCSPPTPDGCLYLYKTPVVASRTVYAGPGGGASETQVFTYATNWEASTTSNSPNQIQWSTKNTLVTTTDNISNTTTTNSYTYTPLPAPTDPFDQSRLQAGQIPVEHAVQYYSGNTASGTPLRAISKTWSDAYTLLSEQTTLEDGQTSSLVTYSYTYASGFSQLHEKDEYDYGHGAPGPILRKTITNYASITSPEDGLAMPLTPQLTSPSTIQLADRPSSVIVEDGSGNHLAETDYFYDQPSVSGGSTVQYDTSYPTGANSGRGNLTTTIEECFVAGGGACQNTTTTYAYNQNGQVISMTDPCGNSNCKDMTGSNHTYTYSYNDAYTILSGGQNSSYSASQGNTGAYLTTILNPMGFSETFAYDYNNGQLTAATDENGQTTSYIYYDPFSRPTQVDHPDGGQTSYAYSDSPPISVQTTTVVGNGNPSIVQTTVMDGLGHVTQTQLKSDPEGPDFTDTVVNGMGRPYQVSNPHRSGSLPTDGITTTIFDALGRTCLVAPPDAAAPAPSATCPTSAPPGDVFTSYSGNCTTVTDEAGKSRKSCSDGLGRLTGVWEDPAGLNYETDYGYDALGNLLTVNQIGDNSEPRGRSFTYDSLSRLLRAVNPESGTITYAYDPNGNLVTKVDARNVSTIMAYDALNRLTAKTYSDGTPPVTFYYDTAPTLWAPNEHNTVGRLVEATTGSGVTTGH